MPPAPALAEPARTAPPGRSYARHRPEEAVLYQLLADHWRSFLAETGAEDASSTPEFPTL